MLLIGESINGSRSPVAAAVQTRDDGFVRSLAKDQVDAGADVLDINGGVAGGDEVADVLWLIDVVMGVTDARLMIDSADPEALDVGVRRVMENGGATPFINSISGERSRIDAVLPLVREFKCPVVGLCLGDQGIPDTAEARCDIATRLHELCTGAGLPGDDLWIDPLVLTVSADQTAARVTMATLRLVKERLPTRTVAGLSNVSFGLPHRPLLNRTFLAMCAGIGIDGVVIDVRDRALMVTVKAVAALRGEDEYCSGFLAAYRAGLLESA
jgi:cobalamin-dependent methionine synthase I